MNAFKTSLYKVKGPLLARPSWPLLIFVALVGGSFQKADSTSEEKVLPSGNCYLRVEALVSIELPVVCSNEGQMLMFQKGISAGWKLEQTDITVFHRFPFNLVCQEGRNREGWGWVEGKQTS